MNQFKRLLVLLSLTAGHVGSTQSMAAFFDWDFWGDDPLSSSPRVKAAKEDMVKAAQHGKKLVSDAHEELKKLPDLIDKAWDDGAAQIDEMLRKTRLQLREAEQKLSEMSRSVGQKAHRQLGKMIAPLNDYSINAQEDKAAGMYVVTLNLPGVEQEDIKATFSREESGKDVKRSLRVTALTTDAKKRAAAKDDKDNEPVVIAHSASRQSACINGLCQEISCSNGEINASIDLPKTVDDNADISMNLVDGKLTIKLSLVQAAKPQQQRVIKFDPKK